MEGAVAKVCDRIRTNIAIGYHLLSMETLKEINTALMQVAAIKISY